MAQRCVPRSPPGAGGSRNSPAGSDRAAPTAATGPARPAPELDEVLTMLDDLADDADALTTRIQALLDDHRPSRR